MYVSSLRIRRYQFRPSCRIWPKTTTTTTTTIVVTETKRPLGLTQQLIFSKGLEFYPVMFSDCPALSYIDCGPNPSYVDFFRKNELSSPSTNRFNQDSANFLSSRNLLYSAATVKLVRVGGGLYELTDYFLRLRAVGIIRVDRHSSSSVFRLFRIVR